MIAGTIIIEDMTLHFRTVTEKGDFPMVTTVTVSDVLTAEQETYRCHSEDFAVALGMTMHPDVEYPMCPADTLIGMEFQKMADKAMPKNPNLRWIP